MTTTITRGGPVTLAFPTGGACAGRAQLMNPHPGDARAVEAAVETCLSCPAYLHCLAWITATPPALDPGGIIAALTETDRNIPNPRLEIPDIPVCRAQLWGGLRETGRRFLVTAVSDGAVRGLSYFEHRSHSRIRTIPVATFLSAYELLEDAPCQEVARVR